MRRFIDILIVLGILVGIGLGAVWFAERRDHAISVETTRIALERIRTELKVRAAMTTELGPPAMIDPAWFEDGPPLNPLLDTRRPWVEIASPLDAARLHPAVRGAAGRETAAFWYNPATGVVRARVPAQLSDAATDEIYAQVNDFDLE